MLGIPCWESGCANVRKALQPHLATTSSEAILGPIDALKLRSSMEIFAEAVPDEQLFRAVLAAADENR